MDENLGFIMVLCIALSDSLSSVWGHSVQFAKCPMLRFSNGLAAPKILIQFQTNFRETM